MKNQAGSLNSEINYKEVFQELLNYRKSYIFCIVLFILVAFLYNKFSPTKYRNFTTVYINKVQDNSFLSSKDNVFQGIGMFANQNIIDNELEIIKSFSLLKKVTKDLDLTTSYYSYENTTFSNLFYPLPLIHKDELYDKSPIRVIIDVSYPQATDIDFYIKFLNDNEFSLIVAGVGVSLYNYIDDKIESVNNQVAFKGVFKFGDEIRSRYFNFRIIKTDYFDVNFTKIHNLVFYFNNINNLILKYQASLSAESTSQLSTMIKVSLKGTNRQRITDFLNSLISVYMERNLDKKNKIAVSTVDFIDSQISDVADSLSLAESRLKTFRSSYQIMDLGYQGQQIFKQMSDLEEERANLSIQKKYYFYLQNYLTNNSDVSKLSAPSSMNVVDPILTNLITQLITLGSERANNPNPQSIYLESLNVKIENLRKTIIENVNNSLNTINMSINELNYRISKLSGQISQMPKTELQLRGIERKFKLNDAIYTFLLQKRSEAQISRAASMPDYEIVDPARIFASSTVSPKTKINYLLALLLGIFIPTSVIFAKDFLNNKIVKPEEIETLTRLPILGSIFHSFRRTTLIVNQYPNSSVTESFRAVRTNFEFFSAGGEKQVILMTSTTSGEGKTFCSINLATAFALNGHRTIILEFDLRRPKIHQEFGSSNMIGISSYLIDKATIDDIIMPTQIENLDLISAGPAAPNPAELIASFKTSELIQKLKEMYDYLIIDSAPAGVLTETYQLMKHSDVNIFVTRLNATVRAAFKNTLKTLEANKFTNMAILINDFNVKRDAYKYGYDNKYYTDDRKRGLFRWLFSRRKS